MAGVLSTVFNNIPFVSDVVGDTYSIVKSLWKRSFWQDHIENAAPVDRNLTVAYVKLKRRGEVVGIFVPELYVLASTPTGLLSFPPAWRVRENGSPKTPFELALLPTNHRKDVQNIFEKECRARRDRHLALPAHISKLRVLPDYLEKINQQGLRADPPRATNFTLSNWAAKATTREKILHFLAPKLALMLTVTSAVAISGFAAPWAVGLGALGLYYAKKSSNDFGMFDLAENLTRDLGWLTAKDIPWKARFSLLNTVKTLGKLGALALAVYFAAEVAWVGTFGLPLQFLGTTALTALAGLFATVSGVGALVGLAGAQRYFWNLSFWDNQINVPREVVATLPVVQPEARLHVPKGLVSEDVVEKRDDTINQLKEDLKSKQGQLTTLSQEREDLLAQDKRRNRQISELTTVNEDLAEQLRVAEQQKDILTQRVTALTPRPAPVPRVAAVQQQPRESGRRSPARHH